MGFCFLGDKSQCLRFAFGKDLPLRTFTPDVKTPTHVQVFPSFSQYESEFDDDKDKNQSARKKKKLKQQAKFML